MYSVKVHLIQVYLIKKLSSETKMIDHHFPKSSKFRKKYLCANLLFFTSLFICNAVSVGGAIRHSPSSLEGVSILDSRSDQLRHYGYKGKMTETKGLFENIVNKSQVESKNKSERRRKPEEVSGDIIYLWEALPRSSTRDEITTTLGLKEDTGFKNLPLFNRRRRKRDIISSMENYSNHDKNRHEKFPVLSRVKAKVEPIIQSSKDNGAVKLFSGSNSGGFQRNMKRGENNLTQEIHRHNYEVRFKNGNNGEILQQTIKAEGGQNERSKVKTDFTTRHRIRHLAKKEGHREIKAGMLASKTPMGEELNEYSAPSESRHKSKQQMTTIDGVNRRSSNQTSGLRFPIKEESSLITLKRQSAERIFFNTQEYMDIHDLDEDSDSSISSSDYNSYEDYINFKSRFLRNFRDKQKNLDKPKEEHSLLLNSERHSNDLRDKTTTNEKIYENTLNEIIPSWINKTSLISPNDLQGPLKIASDSFISRNNTSATYTKDRRDYTVSFTDPKIEPDKEALVTNGLQVVTYPEDDFDLHNSLNKRKNILTTTSEAALLLAIPLALLLTLIILTFAACCCYRHRQLHFIHHQEKGQLKLLGYYDEFGHNPEEAVVGCCGCRALESCCLPDLSYQLHKAEWVKKNSTAEHEKSFVVFEDDLELAAEIGPDLLGHPPLYDLLSNLPPRKRRLSHNGRKSSNHETKLRRTKSVELLCV